MLECPKALHKIYKFRHDHRMYVADVDECRVLEIDGIAWEILNLCPSLTSEEIIDKLSEKYHPQEIIEALEALEKMEREGLLFKNEGRGEPIAIEEPRRLKILAAQNSPYIEDLTLVAGGVQVAHRHLLKSLASYACIDVMSNEDKQFADGIRGVCFHHGDKASLLKLIKRNYDGVLVQKHTDIQLIPLLKHIEAPIVVPLHTARGHNGAAINSTLLWYSAMRDFDAFIVPTESVKVFYSRFVFDTDAFHTIPWGVDVEQFKSMNKQAAKNEVSKMLNNPQVASLPIVGFLSRFQPEKGASLYIKMAELLPEAIFLVIAPTLNVYTHQRLPPNLIYAGRQPRDKLPLFFNAFDVYCFPSIVGEETFGLAVLEAMACGVPPIVPNLDGLPEVVGDAGIIVPATTFQDEIGSFAGYVCPIAMSDKVNALLNNEGERLKLGQKARKRALSFRWDETARKLIALFKDLIEIRKKILRQRRQFSIFFAPHLNRRRRAIEYRAILSNITCLKERPLMRDGYVQTVEEGVALSLLKKHELHEVEAVLTHLCGEKKARDIIEKVCGFQQATSY